MCVVAKYAYKKQIKMLHLRQYMFHAGNTTHINRGTVAIAFSIIFPILLVIMILYNFGINGRIGI